MSTSQASPIAERLQHVLDTLPADGHVRLVAVSKFHPVEAIRQAYDAGQRRFGESRVQELVAKIPQLPDDIEWHFIGHLQTNKVKQLLSTGRIALIESIDTERLLMAVDRHARDLGVTARVLLQLHVAAEETKFGFSPDELTSFMNSGAWRNLTSTHICGLMAMASNTDDTRRVLADFELASDTFNAIRNNPLLDDLRGFDTLSMGMSGDYPLAISAGSNMVRVGSAIFGDRVY